MAPVAAVREAAARVSEDTAEETTVKARVEPKGAVAAVVAA